MAIHNSFTPAGQSRSMKYILFAVLLFAATAVFANATLTPAGDMKISKKEITATASFYQYRLGTVLMEVLAVRAPDGTVRTAFNTCQVCYSSGRGYYTQKGDVLVCNNCGNKFKTSQVELIKGGCNPVGIGKDLKTEDADFITISRTLFEEAKPLFLKWKTR
jgi:hypothetical protein